MQVDYMDGALKNRLWSLLDKFYWNDMMKYDSLVMGSKTLFERLWDEYFKEPLDTVPHRSVQAVDDVRKWLFDSSTSWYDVYDFIELVAEYYPQIAHNEKFMDACNSVLESEVSAYRFVGGRITQIITEEEISEIEEALATPLRPVRTHLKAALDLLSDRKSPDYRNSIKESISAVESICTLITGDKNSTLGQCLKIVKDQVGLHPALKRAFSSLYGYTSSADGIRHALLEEPKLSFEDAKFMLVSCSAFINYLVAKASKAGMKI